MAFRQERAKEIIKKLAAEFLEKEAGPQSLITVLSVELTESGRKAVIFLSVLPEEKGPAVFEFVSRKTRDFKEYVKKHSRLQTIPFFKFQIQLPNDLKGLTE